ncbi:MAG: glycosyltransferase family 4 protein [Chloroflexi bacterium]|nr:glycosyltransferase family 4 protein [Chloroflexota bacterium]
MNILVLSDRYPPFYEGGYELNCQLVVDALRARGHTMTVLTTTFGVPSRRVEGHVHRALHSTDYPYRGRLHRRISQIRQFVWAWQNAARTRRLAETVQPDLAFVWHMLGTSLPPILTVQDAGIRTVYRVESHWLVQLKEWLADEPRLSRRQFRAALIGFCRFDELALDRLIFVSHSLKREYQRAGFHVPDAPVIPTGLPPEWLALPRGPHPARDGILRLVFVGRLESNKGTDIAVEAVRRVVNEYTCRNVSLDLIGRGEPAYIDHLRAFIAQENLEEYVRLRGFVLRKELVAEYASYDVLLFTTPAREGLGMTILEAMSQGLLVIASDIGGPQDIITDHQDGWLVPPGDPGALAAAIIEAARQPELVRQLGSAATQTIRAKHTFDAMLDAYEICLQAACRPREVSASELVSGEIA